MHRSKPTITWLTFVHAFQGLLVAFKEQVNFRVHFFFAFLALFFSWFFHLSSVELLFILLAIFLVFIAELFNSSIEYLGDAVSPEFNTLIKKTKDVAAGSVLLAALFAVIIGLIIFLPYISNL